MLIRAVCVLNDKNIKIYNQIFVGQIVAAVCDMKMRKHPLLKY